MATYIVPKRSGPFKVVVTAAGKAVVLDQGQRHGLIIPCKCCAQAQEICRKLNSGEHNGTIRA